MMIHPLEKERENATQIMKQNSKQSNISIVKINANVSIENEEITLKFDACVHNEGKYLNIVGVKWWKLII